MARAELKSAASAVGGSRTFPMEFNSILSAANKSYESQHGAAQEIDPEHRPRYCNEMALELTE